MKITEKRSEVTYNLELSQMELNTLVLSTGVVDPDDVDKFASELKVEVLDTTYPLYKELKGWVK